MAGRRPADSSRPGAAVYGAPRAPEHPQAGRSYPAPHPDERPQAGRSYPAPHPDERPQAGRSYPAPHPDERPYPDAGSRPGDRRGPGGRPQPAAAAAAAGLASGAAGPAPGAAGAARVAPGGVAGAAGRAPGGVYGGRPEPARPTGGPAVYGAGRPTDPERTMLHRPGPESEVERTLLYGPARVAAPDRLGQPGDPASPRGGGVSRTLAYICALVTVLSVSAVVALTRGSHPAKPTTAVATPSQAPPSPVLPTVAADAPAPTADGVASALTALVGDSRLGSHVTASVIDPATGEVLFDRSAAEAATPASTAKLATGVAVLATRGPDFRIETKALAGANPGEVVLVGGGDPTLAVGATGSYPDAARLDDLAAQVKAALGDTPPTRVVVDSSLFTGPTTGPGWYPADVQIGYVSRITALMTDGARRDPKHLAEPSSRYAAPDRAAAAAFARALGVPTSAVSVGTAPPDARQLGVVSSPPMVRLVEDMLSASDNVVAEMLARQVALATGKPASFEGAAGAVSDKLTELGLPMDHVTIVDGSGLSTGNQMTAQLLSAELALASQPDQPRLHGLFTGLPVAAYSGTLKDRYRSTKTGGDAAGTVRAKTGTLDGVSALAGTVVDADGRLLAFAIIADKAPPDGLATRAALDRIAAALAGCGCR